MANDGKGGRYHSLWHSSAAVLPVLQLSVLRSLRHRAKTSCLLRQQSATQVLFGEVLSAWFELGGFCPVQDEAVITAQAKATDTFCLALTVLPSKSAGGFPSSPPLSPCHSSHFPEKSSRDRAPVWPCPWPVSPTHTSFCSSSNVVKALLLTGGWDSWFVGLLNAL